MRVLVVTPRYEPLVGGVENHVREVVRRMPPDVEVTVLTTDATGDLPAEDTVDGIPVLRVRAFPKNRDYYFAPSLYRVIADGDWDLVHIQSYHTAVAPLAMLAAHRSKIPFVVTLHGGGHSSRLRRALRSAQWRALRPGLARAERIISVAEFEAAFFSERLSIPREKFIVIPNGSDLPLPDAKPSRRRPRKGRIASIGRLEKYKGHHRVIEAMPEVLRLEPKAKLHVVGSGPYQHHIQRLVQRLGLEDNVLVHSIPAADRAAMADELRSTALVVLMSEFETHPLSVIEALALGCPALVADTSGLHELAERGLARAISPTSTASEIAEAIVAELRSPTPVPDIELPTWDGCAAGVAEVYRQATGEQPAGSTPEPAIPGEPKRRKGKNRSAEASPGAVPEPPAPLAPATSTGGPSWRSAELPAWIRPALVAVFALAGLLLVESASIAARFNGPSAIPQYWAGILVLFAPAAAVVWLAALRRSEMIAIVTIVGVALYCARLIHSPVAFSGFDEVLHYRTIDDILQTGHLFRRNPLLLISPYYPGLEIYTSALVSLTGLAIFPAGVLVIGVARVLMVLCLYLFLERVSLPPSLAGLGTLLYMVCPNFISFDAQYAYESLAIPLALFCVLLLRMAQRERPAARRLLLGVAVGSILAITVTHHVTSFILAGTLVLWALVTYATRRFHDERLPGDGWVGVVAVMATAVWLFGIAKAVVGYLWPHFISAASEMIRIIRGESTGRNLFQNDIGQSAPALERFIGLTSTAIILLAIPFGVWYVRKRHRGDPLAWTLAAAACAYPFLLSLRLTANGWAIGARATAFIFVPIAFTVAAAIEQLRARVPRLLSRPAIVLPLVMIVFAGGVVVGTSPHARLPWVFDPGADGVAIETESLQAATWMLRNAGLGQRMVADSANSVVMGSLGRQRVLNSADGVSVSGFFLAPAIGVFQAETIRDHGLRYVLVDRRIAGTLPRKRFFYESWERPYYNSQGTIDESTLSKFDFVQGVSRTFDSGNIQIYDVSALGK